MAWDSAEAIQQLEQETEALVRQLLWSGEQTYLLNLSDEALATALIDEARFFGLYTHGDTVAATIVHDYIRKHADRWPSLIGMPAE